MNRAINMDHQNESKLTALKELIAAIQQFELAHQKQQKCESDIKEIQDNKVAWFFRFNLEGQIYPLPFHLSLFHDLFKGSNFVVLGTNELVKLEQQKHEYEEQQKDALDNIIRLYNADLWQQHQSRNNKYLVKAMTYVLRFLPEFVRPWVQSEDTIDWDYLNEKLLHPRVEGNTDALSPLIQGIYQRIARNSQDTSHPKTNPPILMALKKYEENRRSPESRVTPAQGESINRLYQKYQGFCNKINENPWGGKLGIKYSYQDLSSQADDIIAVVDCVEKLSSPSQEDLLLKMHAHQTAYYLVNLLTSKNMTVTDDGGSLSGTQAILSKLQSYANPQEEVVALYKPEMDRLFQKYGNAYNKFLARNHSGPEGILSKEFEECIDTVLYVIQEVDKIPIDSEDKRVLQQNALSVAFFLYKLFNFDAITLADNQRNKENQRSELEKKLLEKLQPYSNSPSDDCVEWKDSSHGP